MRYNAFGATFCSPARSLEQSRSKSRSDESGRKEKKKEKKRIERRVMIRIYDRNGISNGAAYHQANRRCLENGETREARVSPSRCHPGRAMRVTRAAHKRLLVSAFDVPSRGCARGRRHEKKKKEKEKREKEKRGREEKGEKKGRRNLS